MNAQEGKQSALYKILEARNKAIGANDYKFISWRSVAQAIDMDPGNLSKIVTGVTEPSAGTFIRIINALGCKIQITNI